MTFHMWVKKAWPGGSDKQSKKNPSREGNGVSKNGDTQGMEYKPVKKDPEWDGASRVAKWGE